MSKKLTDENTLSRDIVEEALFEVVALLGNIDELNLRVQQAMKRSSACVDVLTPAVEILGEMRGRMVKTKETLANEWGHGQRRRWKDE